MSGVILGRDFRLDVTLDDGATWEVVGPVSTSRDPSISNPTQDVTTQGTDGDYSENCHTGYAQMSMSVAGIVKEQAGTDTPSGLALFTYKELAAIVNASPVSARKARFRLIDTLESFDGTFLISEFARSGGRSDVQEFTMTLQNEGEITHTVIP